MTVRVRLDRVLARRRMSLAELADRVGLPGDQLELLRSGPVRAVRLSTLDALCRELACTPGDLLAYEPFDSTDEEPSRA